MDFLAGICGPQVEAAPALGAPLGVWLHDATPAEDKKNACSPALVNAKCSLEHGALEETFNGAATAWEIMAKSFEQYGERNAQAAREREAERLRVRLAAVEREAAALRAVGGDDGQCARSRPYYWQR